MNWMNFIDNLQYMAAGMIGIFIVIGIIAGVTVALNFFTRKKKD